MARKTIVMPGNRASEQRIPVTPGQIFAFGFDPSQAAYERANNDLVLKFENGTAVRLADFFAVVGKLPALALSDRLSVDWSKFLQNMNPKMELVTAAGPAAFPDDGIPEFWDDSGSLIEDIDRLAALGTGMMERTAGFAVEPFQEMLYNGSNGVSRSPGAFSAPLSGPGGNPGDTGSGDSGNGPGGNSADGGGTDSGNAGEGSGGSGSENGGTGNNGKGSEAGGGSTEVSHFEGTACAALMRAAEGTNDRIYFQLFEVSTGADGNEVRSPMAIEPGADLGALFSLAESNMFFDLSSLRLENDGTLSLAVMPEVIASIAGRDLPPLETVLTITLNGYSHDMQVIIYEQWNRHCYKSDAFPAPGNGIGYGEWVTGLHGLGGDDTVSTGGGNDAFHIGRVLGYEANGNLSTNTGAGDDYILARGGALSGSSKIFMGEGDDFFSLAGSLSGQVYMGGGDDTLPITEKTGIGWSNLVDGGSGRGVLNMDARGDVIILGGYAVNGNAALKGFEHIDLDSMDGSGAGAANRLIINTGLKDLHLDSLLNDDNLSGVDNVLRALLTEDAPAVPRVTGGSNDSVEWGSMWKEYCNGSGAHASITYNGIECMVHINTEADQSGAVGVELLLIEKGLA